jgi:hypothetical protein
MNTQRLTRPRIALLLASLLAIGGAAAADMSSADLKAAKDQIAAEHKASKASCDRLAGNAKDICSEEADGKEKVANAELQYRRTGSASDRGKVAEAKAEAAYEVAKEKCDDASGNTKDVCMKEAQAAKVKAEADAKMSTDTANARTEASQDKNDADYKVAVEKCDAMSGNSKTNCVSAAKSRYGKN